MKRINHTIRRKKIPEVKLVSLTGKTWYDSNNTPTSWTGATDFLVTGFTPTTGYLIKNVTGGTVTSGYYKWNTPTSNTWNLIVGAPKTNLTNLSNRNPNDENGQPITGTTLFNTGTTYSIGYYEWNTPTSNSWNLFNQISGNTYNTIQKVLNQKIYDDFQLPLFLEATADEMGDMVDFDKNIGHNKISANFTYESVASGSGCTITINNTTTYQLVNIIQANDTNPDGTMNVTGVKRITTEIPEQIKDQLDQYVIIDGQDFSISGSSFTVHWGDGTTSPIGINSDVTKSFATTEERTIRIVFDSPYLTDQVVKVVNGNNTV